MKKIAVVYNSKYGAARQYGKWISEDLKCDLLNGAEIKADALTKYDTIIYGGGIYVGNIKGISLITKNYDLLKSKKIYVYAVGMNCESDGNTIKEMLSNSNKDFTLEMKSNITFFHFGGEMDYKKLSFLHKMMMSMMFAMLKNKPDLTDGQKGMLGVRKKAHSFCDRSSIKKLVEAVTI